MTIKFYPRFHYLDNSTLLRLPCIGQKITKRRRFGKRQKNFHLFFDHSHALLLFGFFLAGSIGLLYHFESKDSLVRLELEEQATLKLQLSLISKNFESIISELLFLSKQNELLCHINFNENMYKVITLRSGEEGQKHL